MDTVIDPKLDKLVALIKEENFLFKDEFERRELLDYLKHLLKSLEPTVKQDRTAENQE